MNKLGAISILLVFALCLTGCWSSKEIEERSVYVGLAIDAAKKTKEEKQIESMGGITSSKPLLTTMIQIVPLKSVQPGEQGGGKGDGAVKKYLNDYETGDSMFEIMRAYSLRRDRAVIGHHLKVIVISTEVAKQVEIEALLDFIWRDNDIRPSCLVFLSRSRAEEALQSDQPDEIPAFHIAALVQNKFRNNKIMKGVTLTKLHQYINSKQSFILQNIAATKGETEFSGAGIISGSTGKWLGNLEQDDVSSISWIHGDSSGGLLKSKNDKGHTILYEIKSAISKIVPKVEGENVNFHIDIQSKGRLIESWSPDQDSSKLPFLLEAEEIFEKELEKMLQRTIDKLQKKYKVDVAGFGNRLRITHPQAWKKLKDNWDEHFSSAKITLSIKMEITDYGSSTE